MAGDDEGGRDSDGRDSDGQGEGEDVAEPGTYEVVIIGAGFGGIGMAVALARAGIGPFVVVEKGAELGGTWRDNVYPGAACDVPSNLYSFSFHPGRWTRRYPAQPEILSYLEEVVDQHGVRPFIRTGTAVRACELDEPKRRWKVTLDDGSVLVARAVVSAVGQLNKPALPAIGGRDTFGGSWWHSARWNHDVPLQNKRVAVIGTGASAIQFVPEVARQAAHVEVFQRTAPYVLAKADRPYTAKEQALQSAVPLFRKAQRLRTFLYGELLTSGFVGSRALAGMAVRQWQQLLERQVPDAELRRRCTPDYVLGCKRVLFSNDWYPTLNQPHVDLVTDPIVRIAEDGVVTADEALHRADVIVYGTGFQTLDFLQPMRIAGRRGRLLHDQWAQGAEAFLGVVVSGFPNLFLLYGPNTNLGGNSIVYMLEAQISYVLAALRAMREQRLDWVDVRPDLQAEFAEWVAQASAGSVWESGCRSWYTTAAGRNTNNWPDHTFRYRQRLRRFDLASYQVLPTAAATGARSW